MKLKKYLIIKKNGTTRITSNVPKLDSDEISMQLNLNIPNQLFNKPTLVADISVDENVASESIISSDVIDNVKELISNSLNVDLNIKVNSDK